MLVLYTVRDLCEIPRFEHTPLRQASVMPSEPEDPAIWIVCPQAALGEFGIGVCDIDQSHDAFGNPRRIFALFDNAYELVPENPFKLSFAPGDTDICRVHKHMRGPNERLSRPDRGIGGIGIQVYLLLGSTYSAHTHLRGTASWGSSDRIACGSLFMPDCGLFSDAR